MLKIAGVLALLVAGCAVPIEEPGEGLHEQARPTVVEAAACQGPHLKTVACEGLVEAVSPLCYPGCFTQIVDHVEHCQVLPDGCARFCYSPPCTF